MDRDLCCNYYCIMKKITIAITILLTLILIFVGTIAFNLPKNSTSQGNIYSAGAIPVNKGFAEEIEFIPFGDTLYSKNPMVSHTSGSSEFIISENGKYEINYQYLAFSPIMDESDKLTDITVNLISNISGIIDTVEDPIENEIINRTVSIDLSKGEKLSLQVLWEKRIELYFINQSISIVKL